MAYSVGYWWVLVLLAAAVGNWAGAPLPRCRSGPGGKALLVLALVSALLTVLGLQSLPCGG